MNNILKTTTLAIITFNLSACLWTGTPDDTSSGSSGMDPTEVTPTGGQGSPIHFTCYNDSNYQVNGGGQPFYFELMHTCVELEDMDWMSEENMAKILDACSATCQKSVGGWQNHCENGGWKSVEPNPTIDCNPDDYGPEYGDDILWLDGDRSVARRVECDLNTTCGDLFGATIADMLRGGVIVQGERPPSGAEQHADLQLRAEYGGARPLDLSGTIEYSTLRCGETACPFYLGDVELLQTADSWRMSIDLGEVGRVDKQISSLYVRLAKPALGISLSDGQVAFPAESLTFRVDGEVAGSAHPLVENGAQSFWVRNPTTVLGRLDNGSFHLEMDMPTLFGSVRFTTIRDE